MPKKQRYYRRPDGLYETIKTINGKRVAFRGKTCAEVDRKLLEFAEVEEMGRPFEAVIDEWYASIQKSVSEATLRVYSVSLKRLKAKFGAMRMREVRPIDIQRYIHEFERRGYAAQTVSIEISVLKAVFAYAVLCGDCEINPVREVKKSRRLPRQKRSALTEEQERRVERYRGEHWLLGLMLLYTGCRRGELLALTWQDIDREAGVIHVNKKLNYTGRARPHVDHFLKNRNAENNNGDERNVPLLAPLAAALPRNRIGKIFTNDDGEYLSSHEFNSVWRDFCRGVGFVELRQDEEGKEVEAFPITPHCFRHSFATLCYEAGVDPKTAAAYLGDTEAITQRIYTELRNGKHADGVERVNAYLELRAAVENG